MKILLGVLLASALPVFADTITKKDHSSLNGTVVEMSGGVLTMTVSFVQTGSRQQTVKIAMGDVATIEFNSSTFNRGVAPKALNSPASAAKPGVTQDVLLLRGGQRKDCDLTSINGQGDIFCGGKKAESNRKLVLRILVGVR